MARRRQSGWYCTTCGALYSTPGVGLITCQRCGTLGLRGFRRIPRRVGCPEPGCKFQGWDDGGVNDDLGQHRRREHVGRLPRLHRLLSQARTYIDPEKHPEWEAAAMVPDSPHGGDRLTDSERLHVEVARHRQSWSERTKRADVRELVRILDRLAPKPTD